MEEESNALCGCEESIPARVCHHGLSEESVVRRSFRMNPDEQANCSNRPQNLLNFSDPARNVSVSD